MDMSIPAQRHKGVPTANFVRNGSIFVGPAGAAARQMNLS
jgi:hypothetical protein